MNFGFPKAIGSSYLSSPFFSPVIFGFAAIGSVFRYPYYLQWLILKAMLLHLWYVIRVMHGSLNFLMSMPFMILQNLIVSDAHPPSLFLHDGIPNMTHSLWLQVNIVLTLE